MSKFVGTGSPVTCLNGCVASSQFYASEIGINILKAGGNAADASVAMAAALGVLEPFATGLGGDAFCLYYNSSKKKVCAMNASGRSPAKLTKKLMNERGFTEKTGYPSYHGLSVTVPGTTLGWFGCVERFGSGKFSMKSLLQPSIDLARNGFPVAGPITSQKWHRSFEKLLDERNINNGDLLKTDVDQKGIKNLRAPRHGEIFKNPKLATVMEELAEKGPDVFYNGRISDSIVDAVHKFGGVLEKDDMKNAKASYEDPISIDYKGFTVWETSPNSQGIVVLIALNILKNIDLTGYSPESPEYWHIIIEVLKLAFADGMAYCADSSKVSVPVSGLLNAEYGKKRAELIKMDSAMPNPMKGCPAECGSDTVYFSVVDKDRNACSFINSICGEFGSGIIPDDCGFCLQNRGANFSLQQDHPNVVAPGKRPYHTLIPGMVTDSSTGEFLMSFGVMGGFMQPQGHVMVFLNCVEFGMNPQQALNYPRIRIDQAGGDTRIQDDMPLAVITSLKAKGHDIETVSCSSPRFEFGTGQAIATRQFWNKEFQSDGDEVMSDILCTGLPVSCHNGCAASSQFLASQIGIDILKAGGNAADASVAMAAALGVTEPFSTGLGGDAFCLYYDASKKKIFAMNASGRSPAKLTRELLIKQGFTEKNGCPLTHGLSVTVPGMVLGLFGCTERFGSGKFNMKRLLQPSIDLARNGFPVAGPITSQKWKSTAKGLLDEHNTNSGDLMKTDPGIPSNLRAPYHGEIFKNLKLATVMEELAEKGPRVFYNGWISDAIVDAVHKRGGVLEKDDMRNAEVSYEDPISIDYKGFTVWETAPNSQGIVVLIALNILKNINLTGYSPNSPEYWHILIEVFKLAFADGRAYCADPSKVTVPVSVLLSSVYGKKRARLIKMDSVMSSPMKGLPSKSGSNTVYFTVVDKDRNACSVINSICEEFGSGIIPNDCGFCLQNRGATFSLQQDHPNVTAPRKRPYHTLIYGMVTDSCTGEFLMSFGLMGDFMQPQGHVQVFLNCVEFGMNPQQVEFRSQGNDEVLFGGADYRHDSIAIGY